MKLKKEGLNKQMLSKKLKNNLKILKFFTISTCIFNGMVLYFNYERVSEAHK